MFPAKNYNNLEYWQIKKIRIFGLDQKQIMIRVFFCKYKILKKSWENEQKMLSFNIIWPIWQYLTFENVLNLQLKWI